MEHTKKLLSTLNQTEKIEKQIVNFLCTPALNSLFYKIPLYTEHMILYCNKKNIGEYA